MPFSELTEFASLCKKLTLFEKFSTIKIVSGLLSIPELQAKTHRLELLQQAVITSCNGKKLPTSADIVDWLNNDLNNSSIAEDPPEDVFIMNVISQQRDFLILAGLLEIPDSSTNLLIATLEENGGKGQQAWLKEAFALLEVSDFCLRRIGLKRGFSQSSEPTSSFPMFSEWQLSAWADRFVITNADIKKLAINNELLDGFVLSNIPVITQKNHDEVAEILFTKPLIKYSDGYILAFPTTVAFAARVVILNNARSAKQLPALQSALMNQVVESLFRLTRGSAHPVTRIPIPKSIQSKTSSFASFAFRVSSLRVLHFVILSDQIDDLSNACLRIAPVLSRFEEVRFKEHVLAAREFLESTGEFDWGYTIVVTGHLGQGGILVPPGDRDKWTYEICRLNTLEQILQSSAEPLDKLILLLTQREEMSQQGLELPNYNGLLNLYAFWKKNGYTLRIPEISHDHKNAFLQIGTDYLFEFRKEYRKRTDPHCENTVNGHKTLVVKSHSDSIYESMRNIPAYLDISDLTRNRESTCVLFNGTAVWLTLLTNTQDSQHHKMMHELSEGLHLLVWRILNIHVPTLRFHKPAIEISLDFRLVLPISENETDTSGNDDIDLLKHQTLPIIKLRPQSRFLGRFGGVNNGGEHLLVSRAASALRLLAGYNDCSPSIGEEIAVEALGGPDAKVLHSLVMQTKLEYLLASDRRRVFQLPSAYVDATMRSTFTWISGLKEDLALDHQSSVETLNNGVTNLMNRIVARLRRFDRRQLIRDLLHSHETLLRDEQRWRSTARAVLALYGEKDGLVAARNQENERTQSKITLRALVEAAVCEASTSGGIQPDGHAIDELFGLMWSLLQLGRDSETIYHELSSDGITVHPSGAYSFTADILDDVGGAYALEGFTKNFEAAAENYERWVAPGEESNSDTEENAIDSASFKAAFSSEFRVESDVAITICVALLDYATERNAVVCAISRDELIQYCSYKEVTAAQIDGFLSSFSLFARPTWAPQRPLAEPRDVQPWRFERRLSVMLRPLLECDGDDGTQYIYGVSTFRQAMAYILESITSGRFDKDVFRSKEMRSYIGQQVDALGAAFTRRVVASLQDLGWKALPEVKMTTLGAGKNPNLGDIDVLAWRPDGTVLIIECKRLKIARSVAEIAHTCNRFKGNSGDHMFKHLRRVEWSKLNPEKIAKHIGLDKVTLTMRGILITSANVPFRYVRDMPIASDDIWFYDDLAHASGGLNT